MSGENAYSAEHIQVLEGLENAINSVIARRSSAMRSLTTNSSENTMDISVYREIKEEVAHLVI